MRVGAGSEVPRWSGWISPEILVVSLAALQGGRPDEVAGVTRQIVANPACDATITPRAGRLAPGAEVYEPFACGPCVAPLSRRLAAQGGGLMMIEGLMTRPSRHGPAETLRRLEAAIASRGMTVFARIDHAAGAEAAGLKLRPTDVVIFGSAKAGTPLMAASQTIGIDLPLKMLVWRDAAEQTFVAYNDPAWLVRRHALGAPAEAIAAKMQAGLAAIASEAAGEG